MKKGLLLVFIGPSGCGKGTVLKEVLARHNDTFLSVSATTREPREGEVNGQNYYFMSQNDFDEIAKSNGFLEYATYLNNSYGTPKAAILQKINAGENVILEIEVKGAKQIKEIYPQAVTIFILPPSMKELEARLTKRQTESEEEIRQRMKEAYTEVRYAYDCDYVVVNDIVAETVQKMEYIIKGELCSSDRMTDQINAVLG